MNITTSGLFKLNVHDLAQAAVNAAVAAIVVGLFGLVTTAGFSVFTAPWLEIGKSVVDWGFIAFIGSVGSALLTNKEGRIPALGGMKVK